MPVSAGSGRPGYSQKKVTTSRFLRRTRTSAAVRIFSKRTDFKFDMGPSWYLAPDLFEHFFNLLGERVDDHLDLVRLQPSYRIFFRNDPNTARYPFRHRYRRARRLMRSSPGSAEKLRAYLKQSEYQYDVATQHFMYKNYDTIFDFFNRRVMTEGQKLSVFSKMHSFVSKFFKSQKLQQVMEYTMVFLGTSPYEAPALVQPDVAHGFQPGRVLSAGRVLRTDKGTGRIAEKNGAKLRTNSPVAEIVVENGVTKGVRARERRDHRRRHRHFERGHAVHRDETARREMADALRRKYWNKRVMAPSAFIMYLGVSEKLPSLIHHNLLFSEDWRKNFDDIYKDPCLPDEPSLYVCAPS